MYLDSFFKNAPHIEINQLSCDSRVPMKDCIYFCIKGIKYNGHEFINEAIENGANVIVYSDEVDTNLNAIFVKVNNVDDTLNSIASKFYDYPSSKLENYVVSGSYGKSSVCYIINHLIRDTKKCASIGILGINDGDVNLTVNQATLPMLDNQKYMKAFVDNGCRACTFEARALALSYKKLDGVNPKAFIYTTTSFESSDYKELGSNYIDSLKRYLYTLDNDCLVVLNRDDLTYEELKNASSENFVSYGKNEDADYVISNIVINNNSTTFNIRFNNLEYSINSPLISEANVYNLTASIAALNTLGYDLQELIDKLQSLSPLDGVYDRLKFDDYNIIVDCAYSVDSYNKLLDFAEETTDDNSKIITLVSINYSDTEARLKPLIGTVDNKSDLLILTVDDTYEETGSSTLKEASSLVEKHNSIRIEDREGAIEEAIELMNKGDTLLIVGKGNENFMFQALVKKEYNGDKNIAYKYMNKRLKEENLIENML